MLYRLVGLPTGFTNVDDVIVANSLGECSLLEREPARLTPLTDAEVRVVLNFYDPALNVGWRTLNELTMALFDERIGDPNPAFGDAAD